MVGTEESPRSLHARHAAAVHAEQVQLLYTNSRIALVTTPVAAVTLAVAGWSRASPAVVVAWLGWMLGIAVVRGVLTRRYLRLAPGAVDATAWGRRFVLGVTAAGLGWGGAGILFFSASSVPWQMFLALVLAGVALASATVLSPVLAAFYAFAVPTLLPIILRFFLLRHTTGVATAALGLIFSGGLILSVWSTHRALVRALVLAFENRDLVANLSVQVGERARAEAALRVARDELERRVEERTAELRRAQSFLHAIIEHIPSTLSVKDAGALRFVLFNRAAERLFGVRRQDVIGRSDAEVFPGATAEAVAASDRAALASGRPLVIATETVPTPDHGPRTLHTQRVPIVDAGDGPRYLMTVSEDVTEQQRLEDQLRQAQKMEAIGRLAGGIAHDFNNLLTVILGGAEALLERIAPDHPPWSDADRVRRAAERAAALTAQLLAFSRRQILAPRVLDLNEIVARMADMVRPLLGEASRLVVEAAPGLPRVKADPSQIEMVILNLLLNARDAMPHGGTITLTARAGGPAGDAGREWVTLAVNDTGAGMDAETIARVFEPFFTTKGRGRGTGLGLATVYGIVTQSGGTVGVSSRPGEGSTFSVYLPAVADVASPGEPEAPAEPPRREATILLAEDEDLVRDVLADVLRRAGFTVLTATDGLDALRKSGEHAGALDVLVTDVVMPGLGGYELAEQLTASRPQLRVLYISGYTDQALPDPERAGVAFMHKPTHARDLVRTIHRLLAEGG